LIFVFVSDFSTGHLTVDIRISDLLLSSASGSTAQYDIRITQYGSIKIERLCKTNPISKKPKMKLNHYTTNDYENKSGLLPTEKQTQSNPIANQPPHFSKFPSKTSYFLIFLPFFLPFSFRFLFCLREGLNPLSFSKLVTLKLVHGVKELMSFAKEV